MKAPSKLHKLFEEYGFKYDKGEYYYFPIQYPIFINININKNDINNPILDWFIGYPYTEEGARCGFSIMPDRSDLLWDNWLIKNITPKIILNESISSIKNTDYYIELITKNFPKWVNAISDMGILIDIHSYILNIQDTLPTEFSYIDDLNLIRRENYMRLIGKIGCLNAYGKFGESCKILENYTSSFSQKDKEDDPHIMKLLSDAKNKTISASPEYMDWARKTGFNK